MEAQLILNDCAATVADPDKSTRISGLAICYININTYYRFNLNDLLKKIGRI